MVSCTWAVPEDDGSATARSGLSCESAISVASPAAITELRRSQRLPLETRLKAADVFQVSPLELCAADRIVESWPRQSHAQGRRGEVHWIATPCCAASSQSPCPLPAGGRPAF